MRAPRRRRQPYFAPQAAVAEPGKALGIEPAPVADEEPGVLWDALRAPGPGPFAAGSD